MTVQKGMACKHQVWRKVTKGIVHEFVKYQCTLCGEERFDENDPEVIGEIPKTPTYKRTEDIAKHILHCTCHDCMKKATNIDKHLSHSFYKEVDQFTAEIRHQQILKGAEKYKEPFSPDSWTGDELAVHAMQELRDGQVYVTGMRDRMRKQAEQIETLKAEVEYWRLKAKTCSEYEKWKAVAEQNGICRRTFNDRVNKGLPYEMAATAPLGNTSPKKYRKDEQHENER